MGEPFFRFFCHVTPPGKELGDLSFESLCWLKKRGLVRVLPLSAVHITRTKPPKPREPKLEPEQDRWVEHEEDFMRPVPDQFINVVCGTGEEAERVHTAGIINIAIVLPGSAQPEGFRIVENEKQLEAELD